MREGNEDRKSDITWMVGAYIERGNKVSKMTKNSTSKFAKKIKELIMTYGLVDKSRGNPDAITLARVAECFPKLTCSYMSYAKNMVVSTSEMNSIIPNYPRQMMCQAFTALIPKEHELTLTLLKAHALFLFYYSTKISSWNIHHKPLSNKNMALNTWKYMLLVHQRSFTDNDNKVTYLESLQIIVKGEVTEVVQIAANLWDDKFRKYIELTKKSDEEDSESEEDLDGDKEAKKKKKISGNILNYINDFNNINNPWRF